MIATRVNEKYEVAIPSIAREKLHIKIGDPLEVIIEPGCLILKLKDAPDTSQTYFWTKEWQKKEKEIDRDYKAGKYQTAQNVDEFFHKLQRQKCED